MRPSLIALNIADHLLKRTAQVYTSNHIYITMASSSIDGTAAPVTLVDVSIKYAATGGLVCDLQLPDAATIKQVKLRLWEMHGYTGRLTRAS